MFCWKCGASNPDTSLFCYKCGSDLIRGQSTPKPSLPRSPQPQGVFPGYNNGSFQPTVRKTSQAITESIQPPMGVIGGRYRIDQELGRGGRGVVFKAFDQELEVYIAIKFLPPELTADTAAVEELKREAKAAMMLSHPNIVRLHNFEDMSGYKFITMEYIDGPTLDEILMRRKQFTVTETMQYAVQILNGLEYAHKKGIIHRDIKPSNLMRTPDNNVKITDYGIASIISDSMKKVSSEFVIGTPRYMSPEQLLGKPLDNRSDLYSLGVVLYEFLNGTPPFTSGGLEYQIINNEPPPLLNVPEKLNYIIIKALSKNANDRWETARQFSDALEGKIKIVLPSEEFKKETFGEKIATSVKGISHGLKESFRTAKAQRRRVRIERRKEVFEKKKKLPGFRESEIFRHSLIAIWTVVFALLFPFNIKVSGINEVTLLVSLFCQAVLFGLIAYWKWFSGLASALLPILAYYVTFIHTSSFVKSKGFEYVLIVSILTGFVGWLMTYMRIDRGYDFKTVIEYRDWYVFWFAVIGGLFIIPILEDNSSLGITHVPIFGYVLLLSIFVGKFYNTFVFPLITLVMFTLSRIGFHNLINCFTSGSQEIALKNEIIRLGSYKTLIWELTVLAGLLSLLLVLVSMALEYFNTFIHFTVKLVLVVVLIGLCLYVYQFWIAKDVYVGSKVYVPAAEVSLGINENDAINLSSDYKWIIDKFVPEYPQHKISIDGFYVDRFEVTNCQYKEFIDATNHPAPDHWIGRDYQLLKDFEPVVGITYQDAVDYANWKKGRLPTEAEWIDAARGGSNTLFPWGYNTNLSFTASWILKSVTNSQEANLIGPSIAGWFYTDMSPYGCFDMGGNVMEWTTDPYLPFSDNPKKDLEPDFKKGYQLVKGGSYNHPQFQSRVTSRYGLPPDAKKLDVGFRCVYDLKNNAEGAGNDGN
jgi:serine/threonine protein kinase/formylglycine-generating enzyme required for sulfatase activity